MATPLTAFEDNIDDAESLLALCRALTNKRQRRMRAELREKFAAAMGISQRNSHKLDCVESADAFIVLKPGSRTSRADFTEAELRPLLRQAIVAAAAAVETYVADKACTYITEALRSEPLPSRLRDLQVPFCDVREVERYSRPGWAYRRLVSAHLAAQSSSDPAKIGIVFSTVGKKGLWRPVDDHRGVGRGTSEPSSSSSRIVETSSLTPATARAAVGPS